MSGLQLEWAALWRCLIVTGAWSLCAWLLSKQGWRFKDAFFLIAIGTLLLEIMKMQLRQR